MAKADSTEIQFITSLQGIADKYLATHNILSSLLDMAMNEIPDDSDGDNLRALLSSSRHYSDDLYSVWERLNQIAQREAEAAK